MGCNVKLLFWRQIRCLCDRECNVLTDLPESARWKMKISCRCTHMFPIHSLVCLLVLSVKIMTKHIKVTHTHTHTHCFYTEFTYVTLRVPTATNSRCIGQLLTVSIINSVNFDRKYDSSIWFISCQIFFLLPNTGVSHLRDPPSFRIHCCTDLFLLSNEQMTLLNTDCFYWRKYRSR